jgi:hypothetical protein
MLQKYFSNEFTKTKTTSISLFIFSGFCGEAATRVDADQIGLFINVCVFVCFVPEI